jgi:ketosteroid isomerase-like protein
MRRLTANLAAAILACFVGVNIANAWAAYRLNLASANQVLNLSQRFHEALRRRDFTALDDLLADDLIITRVDGSIIGKAEWLSYFKDFEFTIDSITTDWLRVEVNGDQARVSGDIEEIAHLEGREPIIHESSFIYSFAKRRGEWKLVAERRYR